MHLQLWENVIFILMKESESQDVKSEFRGKKSELWVLWKKADFQTSRSVFQASVSLNIVRQKHKPTNTQQ